MLCLKHDRLEALAKLFLAARSSHAVRHEELHLDIVDLGAENFDRLSRVDVNFVRMDAEAQPVEQIGCELGVSNSLGAAASPYIGPAVGGDIELPVARTLLQYEELDRARTALPCTCN